jgi:hypothetical protein
MSFLIAFTQPAPLHCLFICLQEVTELHKCDGDLEDAVVMTKGVLLRVYIGRV